MAWKFHLGVASMINQVAARLREDTGLNQVCLSGGVFQNLLLLKTCVKLLRKNGFRVFTHRQVPCNDGGIALGQVVIAGRRRNR
ncbi:MAG TPA: carbamoyltransferase HypF, partial [Bacillota bacterium]|nr:carbamoyltransferase HypF [Bacillota bacterium]